MKKQIILCSLLITTLLPKQVLAGSNTADGNNELQLTLAKQKLETKIDEVFASTPKLAAIYHKIQNSELRQIQELQEYNDLLGSRELKILNNSPEMQETIKIAVRIINIKIAALNKEVEAINEQTKQLQSKLGDQDILQNEQLSAKEIKEKINLNNITSSELKKQLASTMQSFNNISQLYFTDTKLNKISDFTPIQRPDTATTDTLLVSIANLDHLIDKRRDDILFGALGIASGEIYTEYGLWVKGLKSYAKQGEYKLTPMYKLNQQGITIGLDFIDDSLFGVAYSFTSDHLSTNVPNTKEEINSHIANVYGLYKFTDNLFVDIQAKYGKSHINKSRNNLNLSNDIAYAKTTGDIYGGKVGLGYSYNLQEKLSIVPSMGLSYDELTINGYQETGVGFNRKIGTRTVNKTAALLGLKISNYAVINSYTLIPEIHVKVFQALSTNNANTTITIIDGVNPLVTPSGKLPKTIYRIGGSSKMIKSPAIELSLGYDAGISKKFYSHTGYISAKFTF